MRKRIQQLANGKFEYARSLLQLSPDKISIEVLEGKDAFGEFVITCDRLLPVRGVVYTSDSRMECLNPQFDGEEVRIRYQFHSDGMTEGDIQKGNFCIISNQGEYNLSFVVYVTRLYADTSAGKIRNLEDFDELAKTNFLQAQQLFVSNHFRNILKSDDKTARLAYEALNRNILPGQKFEEFLVTVRDKKPVKITLDHTVESFCDVKGDFEAVIELRRENWGYVNIEVSSDADFLVPEKKRLCDDDFVGSTARLTYTIHEELMHAGNNYARVTFKTDTAALYFEVTADLSKGLTEGTERRREIADCKIRLVRLYIDYRFNRLVTGVWAKQTIAIADRLSAMGVQVSFYTLVKAQALLINKQKQEALWLMEDFKHNWSNRQSPLWGYYLYLCTLAEREPSYVDKKTSEIEEIFHRNPDSSLLFWIRLFVREEYYKSPARRLRAIEQWVGTCDCHSPFLYLEAYCLIRQDPYFITKLGKFEIEVLNWARKEGMITSEIAMQVVYLAGSVRKFNRFIYLILCTCYEADDSDEALETICSYLIRGQCFDREYHYWYELGIERELKITSLYEAYLMSLDERNITTVPKMIQMYFQYTSSVAWEKRAVLFVNIIVGQEKDPVLYRKYQPVIGRFAREQLAEGKISDDLAIIYEDMIHTGDIDADMASRLSRVIFSHKLICIDRTMARATVKDERLAREQVINLSGGVGYFNAYSDDYTIVFEDSSGNQFLSSVKYTDQQLMRPSQYIGQLTSLSPKNINYALFSLKNKTKADEFADSDVTSLVTVMNSKIVSEQYKASLFPEIIRFFMDRGMEGQFDDEKLETLIEGANRLPLGSKGKCALIEFLTKSHRYEEALRISRNFSYDFLYHMDEPAKYSELFKYAAEAIHSEDDDFLLDFALRLFCEGDCGETVIDYLCRHYNGASKKMAGIWSIARQNGYDTHDISERILTQILFADEYVQDSTGIYEDCCAGGRNDVIGMAYLSRLAHGYLARDEIVADLVFERIEARYIEDRELNDACKIGLLKYYSALDILTETRTAIAEELLEHYVFKNIMFGFYLNFDGKLLTRFHLYDKTFAEHHTDPAKHVMIHIRRDNDEDFVCEDMTEMYPGIYVREFIIFDDESVEYYISEETDTDVEVTESALLQKSDMINNIDSTQTGRFGLINDCIKSYKSAVRYQTYDNLTRAAFRLL